MTGPGAVASAHPRCGAEPGRSTPSARKGKPAHAVAAFHLAFNLVVGDENTHHKVKRIR